MIEVRSSPLAAVRVYAVVFLVAFLVLGFSGALITAGGDYGVVSSEMAARLTIVGLSVGIVLVPPFAVLYLSNRRRRWEVSEDAVRITEDGRLVGQWAWPEILAVSLAPNGVSIAIRGRSERETLLFVPRSQARSVFQLYVSRRLYGRKDQGSLLCPGGLRRKDEG